MTPLLAMSLSRVSVGRALLARPNSHQQLFRNTLNGIDRAGLQHRVQSARTAVSQAAAGAEAAPQDSTGSSTLPVVIETRGVPVCFGGLFRACLLLLSF